MSCKYYPEVDLISNIDEKYINIEILISWERVNASFNNEPTSMVIKAQAALLPV